MRLSRIVQVGSVLSHGPIKAENFPWLEAKEEGREMQRKRRRLWEQLSLCGCWNPWEGMQPVAAGESKEPAEGQSRPQSYNHKELHLPSDLKELEGWFFPKDSRTEHSMVQPQGTALTQWPERAWKVVFP